MKKLLVNNWHLIALFIMMLAVAVPFFVSDRQFPAQSDDTQRHIEAIQSGHLGYYLQALGIPVVKLAELTDSSPAQAFQWFDLAVILTVMGVLFFVFSRLVSRWAGVMVVFLAFFCSMGITMLFFSGTIFSVINVFIILPLGLYFLIRWFTCQRAYQAIFALVLLTSFSLLHPTAAYLLPILLIFFTVVLLNKKYRTRGVLIVFVIVLAATALAVPMAYRDIQFRLSEPTVLMSAGEFVTKYVSTAVVLLLVFAVLFLIKEKKLVIKQDTKLLVIALLGAVAVLVPMAFLGLNLGRSILDLAIMITLLTACLLGIVVSRDKTKVMAPALLCMALVGSIPMMKVWLFGIGVPR